MGDGVTGALRCVITLPNGTHRAAVLKRLPLAGVAAEAFSAILLRAWGLDVPEPFVVHEALGQVSFASADDGYPSLKQRIGVAGMAPGPAQDALLRLGFDLVSTFKSTPLAVTADEAIDNRDRNLGNVLWDGARESWIDHELAAGLGAHLPDVNKLAKMVTEAGANESVSQSAIAQALAIDRAKPLEAEAATAGALGQCGLASVVATRLSSLAARVLARFPQPHDLLSLP